MSFHRPVLLAVFSAALLLEGCVSVRTNHGYVLERGESSLDAKVGVDTKESVLAKYGEPSMIGTFDGNAWYYLNSRDQARAFFKPTVQDRTVVAFRFDDGGVVNSVENITFAEGYDVKNISRTTPTRGKELSFWEQLLGNVGQLPAGGLGGQQQNGPR
ncbi:MAG: outer membrane protein assembly factor BamE [Pseudomonadota bacterium]